MEAYNEVQNLLQKYRGRLLRSDHHNVYLLSNGVRWTTPMTPSDKCAWDNNLADLKIALGLSLRGRTAKVGERRERKTHKANRETPTFDNIAPAPSGFNFGEKVRAAIAGEKLVRPEALPPRKQQKQDIVRYRAPRVHRERTERHGAVRVWSKEEIEAVNRAMRVGKLKDYMQEYYQAHQPALQQRVEEKNMLSVEQMDGSISELDAGMTAAMEQVTIEQSNIQRLETEIAQAKERMQAAHDKHNSLNDVKTSLAVLRSDIEKVRPMLGHLASQPSTVLALDSNRRVRVADAVKFVLDNASTPLQIKQIHDAILALPGAEHIQRTSLYTFMSLDLKKNGEAIARRVGDNKYVRAGMHHIGAGAA